MASSPITSWKIEEEKVETGTEFLFLGSTITANANCSHEIRWLLLSQKAMTNLGSVLKSRDITLTKVCIVKVMFFLTKVHIVKDMVFPVVMYGCGSWTIKKAERQSNVVPSNCGAGEDPWEALRQQGDKTSQSQGKSTLNTHWKDWCWNIQYLVTKQPTHCKSPRCWERLRAEGKDIRGWDGWMTSPMQRTWTWANFQRWWGTRRPGVLQSMGLQRIKHDWATEQQIYVCTHDVYIYFMHPYRYFCL